MKSTSLLKCIAILWCSTAFAMRAHADVYEQLYDGVSPSVASQSFTGAPATSTYAFDDFVVSGYWFLTEVVVFGRELGIASVPTATHMRITQNPSFTDPGATPFQWNTGPSALQNGTLTYAIGFLLAPGTWYLSAWIDRAASGGEWQWRETTPVRGHEGYAHNPGGGMGFGTSPIGLSELPGASGPRDLSFRISYLVPEPTSGIAMGLLVVLFLFCKRK